MENLKQVYEAGRDVRDSDIPQIWKESFGNFMMGQTCQAETNEDGSVKEFIYYFYAINNFCVLFFTFLIKKCISNVF